MFCLSLKQKESSKKKKDIMRLIQAELSEPYSIYTYRYFIYNWPKLCFLAAHGNEYVGAIAMLADKADEVVLETEMSNLPALRLYENLGFVFHRGTTIPDLKFLEATQ
ncbi:hypothetical protein DOY81_000768 [Sarcophaga bullata]|nr:hypothetical protein DOY81_000768 [Sarcophaga bullata]